MKKRTEEIIDADLYSVIPSRDKKSAVDVSVSAGNSVIDADRIQREKSAVRPRVCADMVIA